MEEHTKNENKVKFVIVDDVPRDVERKYYSMSRSVLTSEVDPRKIKTEWDKILGPDTDDCTIVVYLDQTEWQYKAKGRHPKY